MEMTRLYQDKIDTIVIHITDSKYGDVSTIDQWHKERGWSGCGYHFVITNCFPTRYRYDTKHPILESDGKLHVGRLTNIQGAHVRGHNRHSIGVALVGRRGLFTSKQIETAIRLCETLKKQYPTISKILGHYELDDKKTCPDLDMDVFREFCKCE